MMEIKDLLKEYCFDMSKEDLTDYEPPYNVKEELEIIRKAAVKRRIKERKKKYITAGSAAAAVILSICAAAVYNGVTLQSDEVAINDPHTSERPMYEENKSTEEKQPEIGSIGIGSSSTAEQAKKSEKIKTDTEPMYTYPPKITAPPYYKADISEDIPPVTVPQVNEIVIPKQESEREEPLIYELEGTEKSEEPSIEIEESEKIPSGSSMRAGAGVDEDVGGELWNEEKYFAYIGVNPLSGMKVPDDLEKAQEEEKFVMTNPDGTLYNDRRTFTFANKDRTRLISVTVSREPLTQEKGTTDIHGVMVGIFDNHMSATAVLDADRIHLLIESYGITEEELRTAVYSCAEAIG